MARAEAVVNTGVADADDDDADVAAADAAADDVAAACQTFYNNNKHPAAVAVCLCSHCWGCNSFTISIVNAAAVDVAAATAAAVDVDDDIAAALDRVCREIAKMLLQLLLANVAVAGPVLVADDRS